MFKVQTWNSFYKIVQRLSTKKYNEGSEGVSRKVWTIDHLRPFSTGHLDAGCDIHLTTQLAVINTH